jgi:N-acetylglucosamine-6-phosphate deacetylase
VTRRIKELSLTVLSDYFDVQVNGYGGVDFNADGVGPDEYLRACMKLESDGVGGILATVITDSIEAMCRRLRQIAAAREANALCRRMIAGIHIEGPFINPTAGYRGAHPSDAIHPADESEMRRLLEAAGGLTRIVTLAPENDAGLKVTRMLAGLGVTVSGGHSDASVEQLKAAVDAGMSMYTHLGNGCPMQMHRHDNIVQRVLSLRGLRWISFIADGAHVAFVALGNYLKLAGLERCVITTDCIAPAGLGPGRYTLGRWTLDIGEDLIPWAPDRSHLVGSGVTMDRSAQNLMMELGIGADHLRVLMHDNPRKACGVDR